MAPAEGPLQLPLRALALAPAAAFPGVRHFVRRPRHPLECPAQLLVLAWWL